MITDSTNQQQSNSKVLDLILIVLVIGITCFLFRGSQQQGLSFDEVFRRNNLIPFFNSDAQPYNQSIYNFPRTNIPLIYKNYISSLHLLPDLIWVGFEDYLYGLRLSYLIYFILGTLALYVGLRTISQRLAFFTVLLTVTNPIFFPESRFGFANPIHFFFIGLLTFLIVRYLKSTQKSPFLLFIITFVLFLLPNFIFYSWWIVAAATISACVLYPLKTLRILKQPHNILAIGAGFFFGHLNFILYNLSQNFPSVRPLLNFIFNREKYNQKPIDFAESAGFIEDISNKLSMFQAQFEVPPVILLATLVIMALSYSIVIYQQKNHSWNANKISLYPLLILALTFCFILISPNAQRSGHFIFLSPTWEICLSLILIKISQLWPKIKVLPISILLLLFTVNFYGSNVAVVKANQTRGEKHFSPAFFELNKYINEHGIRDQLVHLHWGFYSQLYFLNRGQITSNSLVFNLINNPSEEETFATFDAFFSDPIITSMSDPIYFPLFTNWHQFTVKKFKKYVEKRGWTLGIKAEFLESNGTPVFNLYELSRTQQQ